MACKNKATWFRYLEFKQEDVFMHRAVEVSFFAKHITFSISIALAVLLKITVVNVKWLWVENGQQYRQEPRSKSTLRT